MTDTKTSQTQKETAASSMAKEQMERFESWIKELEKLDEKRSAKMKEAIDESAKLMKASFDYMDQLGAEWRKIAIENTKKTTEMFLKSVG